jgi:hypothetical protein
MPLTLSRSFTPNLPAPLEPKTADQPIEWLRDAGHQAFDQSAAIVRLNFDWMRRMVRDFGITAGQIDPSSEDWTANWIALAIRHQVRTSALTRAVKRQSGAALRASFSASVSASPTPAADDRAPQTTPARSVDVQ